MNFLSSPNHSVADRNLWFVQRGKIVLRGMLHFLKEFQTMKPNLKVILSVAGVAARQTEVLGLTAKTGHF